MNSKPANFFFRCFSTNSNVNGYEIEAIPIPSITTTKQKKIIALVDKIFAAKKANSQMDTSVWEEEIDFIVYKLYGLTKKEIKVVKEMRIKNL